MGGGGDRETDSPSLLDVWEKDRVHYLYLSCYGHIACEQRAKVEEEEEQTERQADIQTDKTVR